MAEYSLHKVRDKRYMAYYVAQKKGCPPKEMIIYDRESDVDIFDMETFLNIILREHIEKRWSSLVGMDGFDGESIYQFADRVIDNIMHDLVLNDQAQMNMGDFFVECVIDKHTKFQMFCVKELPPCP